MEPGILLAQLRALLERAPNFEQYTYNSKDHLMWLAQAHALVNRWSRVDAISFQAAVEFLPTDIMRESSIAKILGILYRAIADLELKVPAGTNLTFGPGAVYDFFRALNEVIASAEKSLFIIDPYLDHTVFDHYLNSRKDKVIARLLVTKNADQLIPAAEKYKSQYGAVIELRKSNAVHDRVIFVDGYVCWVLGQSVKDAAKAKPTYLAPLAPDVVSAKLGDYEKIWQSATTI